LNNKIDDHVSGFYTTKNFKSMLVFFGEKLLVVEGLDAREVVDSIDIVQ
jgi:hypothetical protein